MCGYRQVVEHWLLFAHVRFRSGYRCPPLPAVVSDAGSTLRVGSGVALSIMATPHHGNPMLWCCSVLKSRNTEGRMCSPIRATNISVSWLCIILGALSTQRRLSGVHPRTMT
jgi:hypothetical protein